MGIAPGKADNGFRGIGAIAITHRNGSVDRLGIPTPLGRGGGQNGGSDKLWYKISLHPVAIPVVISGFGGVNLSALEKNLKNLYISSKDPVFSLQLNS